MGMAAGVDLAEKANLWIIWISKQAILFKKSGDSDFPRLLRTN